MSLSSLLWRPFALAALFTSVVFAQEGKQEPKVEVKAKVEAKVAPKVELKVDTKPGAFDRGFRVLTCAHSFHAFVTAPLRDVAQAAGLKDHVTVYTQSIGGSRTMQHWMVPEEKNNAKKVLKAGGCDVLTLSPTIQPDEAIDNFVALGLEHNPDIRVFVQESWMPYDDWTVYRAGPRPKTVDRNAKSLDELKKGHADYVKLQSEQIEAINKKHGKPVAFTAPVGTAVLLLRKKIADNACPCIKNQNDLFTDAIGHVKPPVMALEAYVYFAIIYKRSPVGLAAPRLLQGFAGEDGAKLNTLLQEIAWQAATECPLSGVKAGDGK